MELRHVDLAGAEEECGDNALGRVRRAFDELALGEALEVVSTVAEQAFAVKAWSRRVGAAILEESRDSGRTRIVLRRDAA
jgi:TusA-related sulfurtransferase